MNRSLNAWLIVLVLLAALSAGVWTLSGGEARDGAEPEAAEPEAAVEVVRVEPAPAAIEREPVRVAVAVEPPGRPAPPPPSPTVGDVAVEACEDGKPCSTEGVRGLSEQLMTEIETMRPGTVASFEGIAGIEGGPGTLPYLQRPAVDALRRVAERGAPIKINSALRSLAQQYLLHRWYVEKSCNIPLAARPGTSNHESGLALDIGNHGELRTALGEQGWRWLGRRDPVHFDYRAGDTVQLSGLSVLAFQRLWNRNNPHDLIPEDSAYGPATAERLALAPAGGFERGPAARGLASAR